MKGFVYRLYWYPVIVQLSPPDTASVSTTAASDSNDTEAIIDYLLTYIVGQVHQRPKDQIKIVVLNHFTKEEILQSEMLLWEKCANLGLDKLVQRLDSNHRPAEDANTDDILGAVNKQFTLSKTPHFLMRSEDIRRLPKYAPGELLNHPCWRGCKLWKPTFLNGMKVWPKHGRTMAAWKQGELIGTQSQCPSWN